ncbi:mandelate racemase/muconate lactonizing enzyme family protein [Oceanibium sediminis]|uniref:mandelate racemase/muconate lactonizing enzyme family protein n=1 Tax=Oceanibium sediminis TaxID=2026339 RepID=UPI000DD48ECF|nr:mandelate racemase/muconate lactonizing enzyme family protein [Oceanibium sediminis]
MKIAHIDCIALDMKLSREFSGGTYKVASRPTIITRVYLENGIVGEIYGGDEFHTQMEIIAVVENEFAPLLVGQDVRDFQRLWELMFRHPLDLGNRGLHQLDMHPRGIIMQAISAVDNAMWDARGKLYGVPVWKLLGGCRDSVPVISIGGYYPADESDACTAIAEEVGQVKEAGCIGIKMKVGRVSLEEDLARVHAARKAGGADFVLTVDANQGWDPLDAIEFCVALEKQDLNVRWMEEPLKWYDQTDGHRLLATKTNIPINVGQGEISGRACRDLIKHGDVNILNLDCTLCGGVTEWQKVAAMAGFMNVQMAHHEEPQIAIHLMAANPHALFVEIFANRERDPLLWQLPEGFPKISDGYMEVPQQPGFGISFKKAAVKKYTVPH